MALLDLYDVTKEVTDLSNGRIYAIQDNVLKETLRELLYRFNNIFYLDGEGNKIQVLCVTGKQERPAGKEKYENTKVLPLITITENGVRQSNERQRFNGMVVSYKYWDSTENRAKRFLSLPSKPINISYSINIWAKYQADMDSLRYSIISLFNPSINVNTKFSPFSKAFFESESDIASVEAQDTTDRILKKSISINVETYLPSPKFLYTNTGEIKELNFEIYTDEEVLA